MDEGTPTIRLFCCGKGKSRAHHKTRGFSFMAHILLFIRPTYIVDELHTKVAVGADAGKCECGGA